MKSALITIDKWNTVSNSQPLKLINVKKQDFIHQIHLTTKFGSSTTHQTDQEHNTYIIIEHINPRSKQQPYESLTLLLLRWWLLRRMRLRPLHVGRWRLVLLSSVECSLINRLPHDHSWGSSHRGLRGNIVVRELIRS